MPLHSHRPPKDPPVRQAERDAEHPPAPSAILQLQRAAGNQAVARWVASRPQLVAGTALIQRIQAGQKKFVGKAVKQGDREGVIKGVKAPDKYRVQFSDNKKPEEVDAASLTFPAESTKPTKSLPGLSEKGEDAPSSSKDEKSQKSSGEGQKDIRFAPRKVQATLLSGGKKWSLVLLTEGGDEVGTLTVSHDGLQHVLATVPALKRGPAQEKKTQEFAIDGTSAIKGHLLNAYNERKRKLEEGAEHRALIEGFSAKRAQELKGGTPLPGQADLITRLKKLHNDRTKKDVEDRDINSKNLLMTRIALDNDRIVIVNGKPRVFTHLYTQPGNQTEMRCYLGNEAGAYQRFHTSITDNDELKQPSHTMIQTGTRLHIPGARGNEGAPRIGFDAVQRDTPGYMHRDLVKRSEGQTGAKGNYEAVVADDDEQKRLKTMAAQFNFVLDMVLKDVCRGEVKERDVLFISGFEVLDDAWDEEDSGGSSKDGPWTGSFEALASPEQEGEDLSPLLGGFTQGEGSVNASLQTVPGFKEVLEAYQIIYISGENWLCFVRSILMALGRAEQTLLQVHKQLRTIYGTGLIEVLGEGVETGSPLAEAILQAIFDVTGHDVGLTLVIPETGGPPSTARGSVRGGSREIFLLHTGAHFSLLLPKKK